MKDQSPRGYAMLVRLLASNPFSIHLARFAVHVLHRVSTLIAICREYHAACNSRMVRLRNHRFQAWLRVRHDPLRVLVIALRP